MRPVERGPWPKDAAGRRALFSEYENARHDLISRIGPYCSYCEARLPASLAVEHCQPKKHKKHLKLDWGNFLLACVNCNSIKGSRQIRLGDYLWPDSHNTFRAFEYGPGALVAPASALPPPLRARARRMMDLVGLGRNPVNDPAASDRRWQEREEVWGIAEESLADLHANSTRQMQTQIVRTALGHGRWSIWMTVFRNEPHMLRLFIEAFPGTSHSCFDRAGLPVARPGAVV